jgi:hypothetical protein
MGATRADLSLGVGPEIALQALRPRLAGEARHLHRRQVPQARAAQTASFTLNKHRAPKPPTPDVPEIVIDIEINLLCA